MSDISRNIRYYRRKNNLSQEKLAIQLNVTRQTVSNWETDKSYPDLDMVIRLSQALNTDPNHLLYPQDRKKKAQYRPHCGNLSLSHLWRHSFAGGADRGLHMRDSGRTPKYHQNKLRRFQ